MPVQSRCKLLILAVLLGSQPARAQQGVTVQLPTFSFFSVATTVVVPDRGGMFMGGVKGGRSGSNRFGPSLRGQSALGRESQASGMHISAQIHDLRAMDESLRGQTNPVVAGLTAAQPVKTNPLPSLKEIEQQRLTRQQREQNEAVDFMRRAQEAQVAGKTALARTYLQMAQRRATGDLRTEVADLLAKLTDPAPRIAAQP